MTGFTDMRKSINGLSIIVSDALAMDSISQAWFVFCNKQRNKLKIYFGILTVSGSIIVALNKAVTSGLNLSQCTQRWVLNNGNYNGFYLIYLSLTILVTKH
jgi:hypothetical protein